MEATGGAASPRQMEEQNRMEPIFHTRRVTALFTAGLLAALVSLAVPLGITPPVTAGPQESDQPPVEETSPPRMVLSKMTHNAGRVERGEMITHRFTFRNAGGSDLMILSTKAG